MLKKSSDISEMSYINPTLEKVTIENAVKFINCLILMKLIIVVNSSLYPVYLYDNWMQKYI